MKVCPHCGKEVEDDVKFCPSCGKPIDGEVKEEAVAEPVKEDKNGRLAMIFGIISVAASLVFGGSSLFFVFGAFALVIPLGFGIPALILGIKTRKASKQGLVGFILGIVGIALSVIALSVFIFLITRS